MQMFLREGIQVFNNCNFMNSLFPFQEKKTNIEENMLNENSL